MTVVADTALEPDSLETIQALVDDFSNEAKRRKQLWRKLMPVMIGSVVVLNVTAMAITWSGRYNLWAPEISLILQIMPVVLFFERLFSFQRPTRRQQAIVDRLRKSNNAIAISPLLAGLGIWNKAARRLIVEALISLLPRLQESDSTWVSDTDQRSLLTLVQYANSKFLRRYYRDQDTDLVIAAIHALSQVGDNRALEHVAALANGKAATDAGKRIQQAARASLIPLQNRAARDRVGLHLLRSSSAPDSKPDLLLTPAREIPAADAQELPRPSTLN